MKSYLMYLRKSRTDRDFTDEPIMQTLRRHKKRLDEYCIAHNIIVPEENILYEVAGADSIASRPMMMELLHRVETGAYEAVLCVDMDRLSRGSGADQALVMNTFKYSNTKIITPFKTYDFNDEMDEQFAELGLFIGRNEYRQIKKRLRQGKVDAVKEGKYPSSNAPYGYKTYKLPKQKGFSLEIVPEEAEIVRLIYRLYTEENLGGQAIAAWLNEHGIKNRQGNIWLSPLVNKILRDPTYIGKVRFAHRVNVNVMRDGQMTKAERNNDEHQLICDGLHVPIIDEDVFHKAERVRTTHFIPHTRKAFETQNPFCGLIKCAHCGRSMSLRSSDNYGRALYCDTAGCTTKGTYLGLVEQDVLQWLQEWLDGYKMLPKSESVHDDIDLHTKALEQAEIDLKLEQHKQKRIYTLLEDGVYTADEYKQRMLESKKRVTQIEERISKEQEEICRLEEYSEQTESLVPRIQSVVERYHALPSAKEKNMLLKGILAKIVYTKDTGGKGHAKEYNLVIYPKIPKL